MPYQKLTNVWLCSGVPLDTGHNHTIMFSTTTAQFAYFQGKVVHSATGCSYQRESMCVAYPAVYDTIAGANYLVYRNDAYSAKYYYAFITNIEYINDSLSYIYFQLDAYQTYMFDITVGQGFVEREHVNDDTIGAHILEEPVAVGPYVSIKNTEVKYDTFWMVVGSTVDLTDRENFPPAPPFSYGGVFSGLGFYCYAPQELNNFPALLTTLEDLNTAGKIDAIVCMFMVPSEFIPTGQTDGSQLKGGSFRHQQIEVTPVGNLNGYTPKNNKLLCYPYRCMEISNFNGSTSTLKFEQFQTPSSPKLSTVGGTNPACRALMYPLNYEGLNLNLDYALPVGMYPQASWASDVYANWLATANVRWGYQQDRFVVNHLTGAIGNAINSAGGGLSSAMSTGSPAGTAANMGIGTISSIANSVLGTATDFYNVQSSIAEEKEVHSIIPNGVRGTVGNDITLVGMNQFGFNIIERTITAEYARTIDDFLSCFGYKVNRSKVPNMTGRASWNYVKCKTITIKGNVPYNYLQEIRSMFLNGCTFWHTTDVGNYSLSNSIVGG